MGITAELRNMIYRLVLVGNERVEVTLDFQEPALLQVSREVRDEAKSIYYCENEFVLLISSFSPALPILWTLKMNMLAKVGGMDVLLDPDMDAHWPNLMLWLQHLHTGSIVSDLQWVEQENDNVDSCKDLVEIMFRQVEDSRATPWVHVEKAMGHFRGLMAAFGEGWAPAKDGDQMMEDASEGGAFCL